MRWSVEEIVVMALSIAPIVHIVMGDYATGAALISVPILGYLIVKYQDDIRASKVLMTFLRKIL